MREHVELAPPEELQAPETHKLPVGQPPSVALRTSISVVSQASPALRGGVFVPQTRLLVRQLEAHK